MSGNALTYPFSFPEQTRVRHDRLFGRPGRRTVLLALLVATTATLTAHSIATQHAPGCSVYRPATGRLLIAHAAGGLPNRKYANSIEALDRSYAHGLRYFEMDFHELPFGIMRAGHDATDVLDPREAWLSQVLEWMRRHPDTYLFPDMKTDNVSGLRLIAARAPDLRRRIIPFLYNKGQYDGVHALGFAPPVYALFRGPEPGWREFANSHTLFAVAFPARLTDQIPTVHQRSIVYTYDVMVKTPQAWAVITNCMVPGARQP
jgi:hypothetical protein